ncbi:unnamed protein product, partial [Rangifer tarandus platyrhynchus]
PTASVRTPFRAPDCWPLLLAPLWRGTFRNLPIAPPCDGRTSGRISCSCGPEDSGPAPSGVCALPPESHDLWAVGHGTAMATGRRLSSIHSKRTQGPARVTSALRPALRSAVASCFTVDSLMPRHCLLSHARHCAFCRSPSSQSLCPLQARRHLGLAVLGAGSRVVSGADAQQALYPASHGRVSTRAVGGAGPWEEGPRGRRLFPWTWGLRAAPLSS